MDHNALFATLNNFGARSENAKAIKSGKMNLSGLFWRKAGTGTWEVDLGNGRTITLSFHNTTQYSVKNRLRDPKRTKFSVYAYVEVRGDGSTLFIPINFSSASGETQASSEKTAAGIVKAQAMAAKIIGELHRHDFRM